MQMICVKKHQTIFDDIDVWHSMVKVKNKYQRMEIGHNGFKIGDNLIEQLNVIASKINFESDGLNENPWHAHINNNTHVWSNNFLIFCSNEQYSLGIEQTIFDYSKAIPFLTQAKNNLKTTRTIDIERIH